MQIAEALLMQSGEVFARKRVAVCTPSFGAGSCHASHTHSHSHHHGGDGPRRKAEGGT